MPKSFQRTRKRKFINNQYTTRKRIRIDSTSTGEDQNQQGQCNSSQKKISENLSIFNEDCANDDTSFNIFLDFSILKKMFTDFGQCPECLRSRLKLENNERNRSGFCLELILKCTDTSCKWEHAVRTSKEIDYHKNQSVGKKKSGRNTYAINTQAVLAFREIGKGFRSIKSFASLMNMPKPISLPTYNRINDMLHGAYEKVCKQSMEKAASDTAKSRGQIANETIKCPVSVDGSWQKRGYASMNGIVSVISNENGKCLDVHVMSKRCHGCAIWKNKENSPGYIDWKLNHDCQANHEGSSGSMEAAGAIIMFARSVSKNNLMYTEYIGDGDTSSFTKVQESKPYNDTEITKLECVGHVQKRCGSRCRTLIDNYKKQKLSDGKGLSGRGRLTDKAMNTLQNYYGMAIRQNVGQLYAMKKSVWATLYHNSDIKDENVRHQFCPRSKDSWCLFQADKITGKTTYKKKLSLPVVIQELLTPIWRDLSNGELLSKCLHGYTQNNNEALNGVIWKKCPKDVYISKKVLEIGVYSAIIEFNDGRSGLIPLMKLLGLPISSYLTTSFKNRDCERINKIGKKSTEKGKQRRKKLRAIRKGFEDKNKEQEKKPAYASGAY